MKPCNTSFIGRFHCDIRHNWNTLLTEDDRHNKNYISTKTSSLVHVQPMVGVVTYIIPTLKVLLQSSSVFMCSLSRTIKAAYSSIFRVKTVMGPTKSTVKKSRFIACATDIIQCNSTGTSSKECPRVGESDCERKSSKTKHD